MTCWTIVEHDYGIFTTVDYQYENTIDVFNNSPTTHIVSLLLVKFNYEM